MGLRRPRPMAKDKTKTSEKASDAAHTNRREVPPPRDSETRATGAEEVIEATSMVPYTFDGDALDVATTPDGEAWVALAPLCVPFDVGPDEQVKKLKKLAWAQTVKITVWENGLRREVFCINIRSIAGWLFTLNAGK